MARRVLEKEWLAQEGIELDGSCPGSKVSVVKEITIHKSYNGVYCMQFNVTGDVLAVGYGSGGIQLFDARGNSIKDLRQCRQGGYSIMALKFHPKEPNILYAASSQGIIHIYDIKTGEEKGKIEEEGNEINTIDFCVDGYFFATGGRDLNVRVYETKANRLSQLYDGRKAVATDSAKVANTMRVFSIKFHTNNPDIFISGGWDNQVKIWDCRASEGIRRTLNGRPHICGDSLDMKGNTILTGQWTALHGIEEFDYTSGNKTREIQFPHKDGSFLYACQYVNDSTVFAGGSGTSSAHVIEIGSNKCLGGYEMSAAVHCVDSALDGKVLAVGGGAPKFAILKLEK